MFWRVLDGCLGTSGAFGRAIARHFLDERDSDDDRDRQTTAEIVAGHLGVDAETLGRIHEDVLDTIHARFPLLGKLCETLWPDPAEPIRAACVLGAGFGSPTAALRLDAAVGLELMNLGIHFHDDLAQRTDDEHPDRLAARNSFAIAAGDHLAAEAYRIFSRLGADVVRLAGRTTEASIRGRVRAVRASNATMDDYLAVCRDSTGEIYGFAVALGCLVARAGDRLVEAYNQLGVELGILVALVDEFEDLRRYVSRRPIARWVTGRELPHLALILTPPGERVVGETARLLALARSGDFAAGAALASRLVSGGQATGVRHVVRQRLGGIERRVAELGPPALPLLQLGRNVADRLL